MMCKGNCGTRIKQPQKHMCSRDFGMCKYCAFKYHREAYKDTYYRPVSERMISA